MLTDNISMQMPSIVVNNSSDLSTNSHQQFCNDLVMNGLIDAAIQSMELTRAANVGLIGPMR